MSAPKQFSVWDLITFPARCLAGCVTLRCLGTTASPRWAAELVIHKSCEQGRQRWSQTSHLTWRNQTKAHQKHFYSKIRGRASLIGGRGFFLALIWGEKKKKISGELCHYILDIHILLSVILEMFLQDGFWWSISVFVTEFPCPDSSRSLTSFERKTTSRTPAICWIEKAIILICKWNGGRKKVSVLKCSQGQR